ncbi:hypothetical protein O181_114906 [Austropuccinia psidii MF-1]|uniref:Uncharacterized protein n=1 Tax=Austropuccinia psidii MF-1 TaxID=1389203 RepID=A0A9Q3K727_9BASI|nr:hypothetical protein [Austropuccinia psidii MF-1]
MSSDAPASQRLTKMENSRQVIKPRISLETTLNKLPGNVSQQEILERTNGNKKRIVFKTVGRKDIQDQRQSCYYPGHRREGEPEREYSDSFRVTKSLKEYNIPSGFTPSDSNRSVTKIHHSSQSQVVSRRRKGSKGKKKHLSNRGRKGQSP